MFNRIMVCLDGTKLAENILPYAVGEARKCGSKLILFHVCVKYIDSIPVRPDGQFTYLPIETILDNFEKRCENMNDYLDQISSKLRNEWLNVEVAVVEGLRSDLPDIIVKFAEKNNVDLIAMATHGRKGIKRFFWGSVVDSVSGKSSIPVLTVRPSKMKPFSDLENNLGVDPETLIGLSV
jgi:nucleotide-binding universal stress UspA family protein